MVFLCVMLTKMVGYRKGFDKTKQMSFLIENNLLLKNVIISFLFKYYTLTQKIYSHQTLYLLVCQGINQQKNELLKKYNDFFFIQMLHTYTENLQSPGSISFGMLGNQSAEICSKVNQIQEYNFESYSIKRIRAKFCRLMKHT